MPQPLIAGIDPGTTAAYALLDMEGNLLEAASAKELGLNEMIARVSARGLPLIVSTDKAKVPDFVQQFAAKTGAKIFSPREDVKAEEKRKLTSSFFLENIHQSDAVASALLAFNSYSSLLTKIRKYAKENSREGLLDAFYLLVVKEGRSLKDADDMLKQPEKIIEQKPIDHVQKAPDEKYQRLKNDIALLRQQNIRLTSENNKLEQKLAKMQKIKSKSIHLSTKKLDALFSYKEKRQHELQEQAEAREGKIRELEGKIEGIHAFLSRATGKHLLKKLKNLGWHEFEGRQLRLAQGDLLLVDDANVYSPKTLDALKGMIRCIVYKTKLSPRTHLPFPLIHAGELELAEIEDFALCDKEMIEKKLRDKEILASIVKEYQETRAG